MRRVSLARQLLVLQLVVVVLTVGLVAWAAIRVTDDRTRDGERDRALSVARTLAASPAALAALDDARPSRTLQPLAETVRRRNGLGFVVFMSTGGIRYSHPVPAQIGERFVGTIAPAVRGGEVVEETAGTLGPSVRAVVPIRDTGGRVRALVAVGVLQEAVSDQIEDQLPALLGALAVALLLGGGLTHLLARRVRRHTRGMGPEQLATLYAHHDAVLHAIGEGVVVVGDDGRIRLLNAEAQRLLGAGDGALGRPVADVVESGALAAALAGRDGESTGLHVVGGRVLVSATRAARDAGTVTTLRDRTELEAVMRELATVRGLADALRAQAHESANVLHTVTGLVELGRYDDAVAFATRRLDGAGEDADRLRAAFGDPEAVALLLAKAAACRERGVALEVDPGSALPAELVPADDLVTILGNLVDNALDAGAGRIVVAAHAADEGVVLRVRDDGPGFPADALDRAFEAGWSTKERADAAPRGLGLALVATTAARLGGAASLANDGGAVVTVRVPARAEAPA